MKTLRLVCLISLLSLTSLVLWRAVGEGKAKSLKLIGSVADAKKTPLVGQNPSHSTATAALSPTLVADYQFQNTLSSSVGIPPALTNLGNNSFESVTIDDSARTALKFDQNNGLALSSTTGLISNQSYTVVMLFTFINTSNYRRILDFKNGTSDCGLYSYFGELDFSCSTDTRSGNTLVVPNTFVQVALTRDTDGNVNGYVNGVHYISRKDTSGDAAIDSNNTLRFFRDNNGDGQASAGYVARIRLYNVALSSNEVAALDRLPNPQAGCPSISGISPISGSAGTSVTITGSGLTGITAVKFSNNVTANFTVNDDTQITAIVPSEATTGIMTLSKPGCGDARTTATFMVSTSSLSTLVADYQFQNTLSSSVGIPPALTNLGNNSFESVTIDSSQRAALKFDPNNGVALFSTAGLISNQSYTVVMLFTFINTSNYRRILDFKNGTSDCGLYSYFGELDFSCSTDTRSGNTLVVPNTFVQVALTRDTDGNVNGYVNGVHYISRKDTSGDALIEGNALRFFRDNNGDGQASAGYVARIRLYNVALSSNEVAALDRLPSQQASCPIVSTINPTSGAVSSSVAITGANFTGISAVKFASNMTAQFTVNSDTSISATVPNGAISGPITISKANCSDAQTATFTVTPTTTSRVVRVVCTSAAPGGTLTVPIELTAQGDENALGFSLTFDTLVLSNPQATKGSDAGAALLNANTSQTAQGRFGVTLALPSGQAFAAGTRQVTVVTFSVSPSTTATTTTINFGDAPIARQVSNANAQSISANYQGCVAVAIARGYEADVTPRPNGKSDGTVTITDWVQVGRFAAGLDAAAVGGEFQRADCAPRDTKGDGQVAITDWVQAGRYAAGLDQSTAAGGPTGPASVAGLAARVENTLSQNGSEAAGARTLRAVNMLFARGQTNTLSLELDTQGGENAAGFSLNYDPSLLTYSSSEVGSGANGALLIVNTGQATQGHIGFALALPAGQGLATGTQQIVRVRFATAVGNSVITTPVSFADQPIKRQVSDVNASALSAAYSDATVTVANAVSSVLAASYSGAALASEAIATAYGQNLAATTQIATTSPLPTSLAGTTVKIKDGAGTERLAPLFFVSSNQINYQVPPGTTTGTATVTVTSGNGSISMGTVQIASVAPGLFTFNSDGQGVVVAIARRFRNDQEQFPSEPVAQLDVQNRWVTRPIDLGPGTDLVILEMFGTGIRFHSDAASAVTVKIGGADGQLFYAGLAPGFVGLDQVDVAIPRSLIGRGEVDVVLMVDGKTANTVKISIK